LEVAEEKTKIIELVKGDKDSRNRGNGGGNSFDFLGFTHYVTTDEHGRKQVKQKTSKKKYKASILRCKEWIKKNRTVPIKDFMKILKQKIQGHISYYGITGNRRSVGNFIDECRSLLFKWLNRRSQKKSFDWNKFALFLKRYPLPKAKVYVNIYSKGAGNCYL
jgi:RNA-directed DNA polymerase